MRKHPVWAFSLALLCLTYCLLPLKRASARPLAQDSIPTAPDVNEAVNALRIANGLLPLNSHPVLMQVGRRTPLPAARPGIRAQTGSRWGNG